MRKRNESGAIMINEDDVIASDSGNGAANTVTRPVGRRRAKELLIKHAASQKKLRLAESAVFPLQQYW